jgi:hypothetical protein
MVDYCGQCALEVGLIISEATAIREVSHVQESRLLYPDTYNRAPLLNKAPMLVERIF